MNKESLVLKVNRKIVIVSIGNKLYINNRDEGINNITCSNCALIGDDSLCIYRRIDKYKRNLCGYLRDYLKMDFSDSLFLRLTSQDIKFSLFMARKMTHEINTSNKNKL